MIIYLHVALSSGHHTFPDYNVTKIRTKDVD